MTKKLPKLIVLLIIAFCLFLLFPTISSHNTVNAQTCSGSLYCITNECNYYDSSYSDCTPDVNNPDCTYKCKDVTSGTYPCSFTNGLCTANGGTTCNGDNKHIGGKCVRTYANPPIGYSCVSNSCTAVYSGTYTYSSSTCDGACVIPPPPPADSCGWFTNADQCYSSGGSFNSGNCVSPGECDCCTPQNTPPSPPPYGCSNNTCQQVDGPYSGDPSCASSCGIKCSITAPADTKVASTNNSKSCNIQGQNNVNNPSKIDLNCSSQEHAGQAKNWRIQKLVIPDLNGVGANGIYTNNGTTVTDNTAGKILLSAASPFGAGVSTKKINLDFSVKLALTNPAGITDTACSNLTFNPTTTSGVYRASTKCGTQVNNNNSLRTNSLAVVSSNGWGNLSYNGSNISDSSSKASGFIESFSSVTVGIVTTYFYTFTFDVSISHNVSTTINGVSVFCEPILFPSSTSTYAVGNISCRGNTTEPDIRIVLLEKFNMTGLRSITMSVNNNIGTYGDVTGRIYKQGGVFNDSVSAFTATGNTYTNNITIIWPDGIPYASRVIKMWITDGTADASCGTVESSTPTCAYQTQTYTVDTSLPIVEREVTVDSTTLLKVVHKATDDYQLKSHSLYCGPTAFSGDPTITSPFISERRLNADGTTYTYIGSQQIAGYFGADPNIKTCDGNFLSSNSDDFKTFNTTSTSETRSTYYLLDENNLKNQNDPYEITFGDGKDGSTLGKWYAEDSFCNLPASSPKTTVDIGSPWLQTKGGNTYVQGHSDNPLSQDGSSVKAYNYTVNNITFDSGNNICTAPLPNGQLKSYLSSKNQKSNAALTSYINRINQCPEKDDSYVSTYALSSNEVSGATGPRGNSDRFSKISQNAVSYSHKLNNVSSYTGGDKNLFDYLSKLVDTSAIVGYSQNNTETITDDIIIDGTSPLYSGSELAINYINHSVNVDPVIGGNLIAQLEASVPSVISAPITVYKINGNLNVKYNTANSGVWTIQKSSILLVDGDVTLEPDIIKSGGSLVIVAKGSIVIGSGRYKSAAFTKDQVVAGTAYPLYDQIDAFLITDGKLITLPDKGGSSAIASNPIKPIENIALKPEVKLNNDIVKNVEAQSYPCKVSFYKDAAFTQPFTAGENVTSNQSLNFYMHRSLNGAYSNYNWGFVTTKVNGAPVSNLRQVTDGNGQVQYLGTHTMVEGNNIIQFGVDMRQGSGAYDATNPGSNTAWCEPFTLVGPVVAAPVTQCTSMTITNGVDTGGDVAVTPGTDITVVMTVLNPDSSSNLVRINNTDNKCNSTRSHRAALDPISQFGTYSNMSRGATDMANFQDCEPPATSSIPTTRFQSVSSVVNGSSTTYTFKIKAEQLLKKDLNTGLPIRGIEIAGPAEHSDSVNCKVYAHDNRIVYDGLKIYGGVVQTSSFPRGMSLGNSLTIDMNGDGINETDLTCKTSGPTNNNQYPSSTNPSVVTGTASPCFLRDLIMVQNFVAPAEQIEYDPSIQVVFGNILGRKSTILSIRESTDD